MRRGYRLALLAVAYISGIADALHAEPIRVRDAYDRIVTLRAPGDQPRSSSRYRGSPVRSMPQVFCSLVLRLLRRRAPFVPS
jgi:hypothetical protein